MTGAVEARGSGSGRVAGNQNFASRMAAGDQEFGARTPVRGWNLGPRETLGVWEFGPVSTFLPSLAPESLVDCFKKIRIKVRLNI